MPTDVELANIPDVELIRTGKWPISTGEWTVNAADLASAVAALNCPAVRKPRLKLGHVDPRFNAAGVGGAAHDGEPAVGWVDNLRVADNGQTLVGDYRGMPGWLGKVMASAYPDRSVEGFHSFRCTLSHTHPFVVTGVALLGTTPPGVGTLRSLSDVARLYGVDDAQVPDGAVPVAATFRHEPVVAPTPARPPGVDVQLVQIINRHVGGGNLVVARAHFRPDERRDGHGRWTSGGDHGHGGADKPGLGKLEHPGGKINDGHGSDKAPMTDAEFKSRAAEVERVIGDARHTLSTDVTYGDGNGGWNPERDALHREIAADMYRKASAGVPRDGKAVIAGGLGGAGKTTVLKNHAGIDPGQYVTVNPDDIKEELARRGLIPDVPGADDLSPMERAPLVHEESSRIGHMMADMAHRERRNLMWDITMSSGSSVQSRVDNLKAHGYGPIQGVFVDIPTDVSVARAMSRYRRGVDKFHAGDGYGGRYVPPSIIRAQQTSGGSTINRQVFDSRRGQWFDSWAVYDNSVDGRAPQLVDRGTGKVK